MKAHYTLNFTPNRLATSSTTKGVLHIANRRDWAVYIKKWRLQAISPDTDITLIRETKPTQPTTCLQKQSEWDHRQQKQWYKIVRRTNDKWPVWLLTLTKNIENIRIWGWK